MFLQHETEINGVLSNLCAHIGEPRPGEPPEDGEINEMTLQTQDSEAAHATSLSQRLPTLLNIYEWAGRKQIVFFVI